MNRERLRQLLDAGLINRGAYIRALGQLNAGRTDVRPGIVRDQELAARRLDVDASSRTITVIASKYDTYIPSHFMILAKGSLTPRAGRENKMLVDHDLSQPVGFMKSSDPESLETTYEIPAGAEGDRALEHAANGLRDAASVGFTITDYAFDDDGTLRVLAADWYETSLVAVPAVAGSGVTDVAAAVASTPTPNQEEHTVNRQQLAAALSAGSITQEQHDTALAVLEATERALANRPGAPAAGAEPVAAEVAAGPTHEPAPAPTARLEIRQRGHNLRSMVNALSAKANLGEIRQPEDVNLAIGEFLPADDAGDAFGQPEWLGELITLTREDRPWIDAFGATGDLTRLKAKGWRWEEEPDVEEHALDLSDVPGNDPKTEGDDYTAFGVAAAHRVQRSFVDFADPEFTQKFLEARMRRYRVKSNIGIRTRVLAAATKPTGTVTSGGVVAVLKQLHRDVRPFGGKVNRMFLADDLFEEFEDLPTGSESNLPLWLKSAQLGIDLADGSANVGQLRIVNDSSLPTGQATAFDTRAGAVKEKNPIELTAVPISVAAVDFGFFGYLRFDDYDPRAIVTRTYVPAVVDPEA